MKEKKSIRNSISHNFHLFIPIMTINLRRKSEITGWNSSQKDAAKNSMTSNIHDSPVKHFGGPSTHKSF